MGTKPEVTQQIPVIPISGWKGDNLLKPTENMPWWKGVDVKVGDKTVHVHTLHDALNEMVSIPARPVDVAFRMPVSANLKIKGVGNVICGRIEQGTLKPGQEASSCLPTPPLTLASVRSSPSKCTTRTCLKPFLVTTSVSRTMRPSSPPSASTLWSKP